jgi:farnesyl diphosphate synthase
MMPMNQQDFKNKLAQHESAIQSALDSILTLTPQTGETTRPRSLIEAMRHGALNGGKRLRPILMLETAALFDAQNEGIMQAACALECVHCYSLIHDDLPAMDDDDLRRGKPTVHKAYNEAEAILAGDALLTLAFDLMAQDITHKSAEVRINLVRGLAQASGLGGMAGGQSLDLSLSGNDINPDDVVQMQTMKTGALIRYACEAGAIIANASNEDQQRLRKFGEIMGLAFQLKDDLLDQTSDAKTLGKAVQKDADKGKATFIRLQGMEDTQSQAHALLEKGKGLLQPFGEKADMLLAIAQYIIERKQ